MAPDNHSLQEMLEPLEEDRLAAHKKGKLYLIAAFLAPVVAFVLNLGAILEALGVPGLLIYPIVFFLPIAYKLYERTKIHSRLQAEVFPPLLKALAPDIQFITDETMISKIENTGLRLFSEADSHSTIIDNKSNYMFRTADLKVQFGLVTNMHLKGDGMFLVLLNEYKVDANILIVPAYRQMSKTMQKIASPTRRRIKYFPAKIDNPQFHNLYSINTTDEEIARTALNKARQEVLIDFASEYPRTPYCFLSRNMVALIFPAGREFKEVSLKTPLTDAENLNKVTDELKFYLDHLEKGKELVNKLQLL